MVLEHKVVVISGATGGLGRVAARLMAQEGVRLALMGRSAESLSDLAKELDLQPDRVLVYAVDFSDPAGVEQAAQSVVEKFGRLDVVLHLVGGWVGGEAVIDLQPGDVASMLDQHAWTTLHAAQKFLPPMLANHWGRFMVVISPAATSPGPKGAPYAMGKAAQQALMLTMAQELKGSGVTANLISVKAIDADHAREREPSPKNAAWATPEEIVAAMIYLCSDEAQLVNGAVIPIYGG